MEKKYQIVLIIFLFVFLIFISFLFSPFFHLRDFVFHSRREFKKNELRVYVNKFYGDNLLFLNEDEIKNSLLKHQLISAVQIEKSFPSTVHVIIEARRDIAWLKNNQKKLIFSADGIILRDEKLETEIKLPELANFPYYFQAHKIILPDLTREILNVLNGLEEEFLAKIVKIIYQDNIYKLYLRTGGGVNLGRNNDLEAKFSILRSILKNSQDKEIDYINLKSIKHPVIKYK